MVSSVAEIPLFHVLNARITFGNVNKCNTEVEAKTTPAATPTSSAEDEEAAGKSKAVWTWPKTFLFNKLHFCSSLYCVLYYIWWLYQKQFSFSDWKLIYTLQDDQMRKRVHGFPPFTIIT